MIGGHLPRWTGRVERTDDQADVALEPLHSRLETYRRSHSHFHPGKPFSGEILLEVERELPFESVRRVAGACARAGYTRLAFMGVHRPQW